MTEIFESPVLARLDLFWKQKLPVIYQTEISECGLACLAMIAGYYGHKTDLRTLRKDHSITLKGVTLAQVVNIAERLHLSTRAIKVELEDLKMIRCPAILHWDMNHFVVLKKANNKEIVIHDPARGVRKIKLTEASKHFSGVAMEAFPDNKFEKKEERKLISIYSFMKGVVGFKRSLLQIFVLSLVLQFFGILAPYYTQMIVDNVLVGRDTDFLVVLGVGFVVLAFFTMVISTMRTWMGIFFDSIYSLQLSSGLTKHMMYLPINWYETRHVGDILSRFSSLKFIQNAIVNGLVGGTLNLIIVIATLVAMLAYSPIMTCISLAGITAYSLLRVVFYQPFKQATEESIVRAAEESSVFIETIRSASPIKLFSKEVSRHGIWLNKVVNTVNANIVGHKLNMIFSVCQTTISSIESVIGLWVGANLVISNELTIGMLFAFIAWRTQFVSGIYSLINGFFNYKMLSLHFDRVADIALEEREKNLEGDGHAVEKSEIKGKIELKNIYFRFGSQEPWLFENFSLIVEPGECVCLIAPSGFGKTTLLKIMMGLIEPEKGEILLDGRPIQKIGLRHYRDLFASVMQDDRLLSGTIEENITFFDGEPNHQKVLACAKLANVNNEIEKMPLGYKSVVGELGSMLSGGQQQRILLARAFYKEPKILFLDEATSHLDKDNEQVISKNIMALNITRVQITHKEVLDKSASRVIDLTAADKHTST